MISPIDYVGPHRGEAVVELSTENRNANRRESLFRAWRQAGQMSAIEGEMVCNCVALTTAPIQLAILFFSHPPEVRV
jgi:hypothetical protein